MSLLSLTIIAIALIIAFDDIIEVIYTRLKIEEGLKDSKENNGLTTEELLENRAKSV